MQTSPSLAILLASDDAGYLDSLIGILEFLVSIHSSVAHPPLPLYETFVLNAPHQCSRYMYENYHMARLVCWFNIEYTSIYNFHHLPTALNVFTVSTRLLTTSRV